MYAYWKLCKLSILYRFPVERTKRRLQRVATLTEEFRDEFRRHVAWMPGRRAALRWVGATHAPGYRSRRNGCTLEKYENLINIKFVNTIDFKGSVKFYRTMWRGQNPRIVLKGYDKLKEKCFSATLSKYFQANQTVIVGYVVSRTWEISS